MNGCCSLLYIFIQWMPKLYEVDEMNGRLRIDHQGRWCAAASCPFRRTPSPSHTFKLLYMGQEQLGPMCSLHTTATPHKHIRARRHSTTKTIMSKIRAQWHLFGLMNDWEPSNLWHFRSIYKFSPHLLFSSFISLFLLHYFHFFCAISSRVGSCRRRQKLCCWSSLPEWGWVI